MTVPSATSRTNEKADELEFYLRGALIGYGPDAVARILDGFREHRDAALSEERRRTVERIREKVGIRDGTLLKDWRIGDFEAILDEIGGSR